jgi:hypothetical protein
MIYAVCYMLTILINSINTYIYIPEWVLAPLHETQAHVAAPPTARLDGLREQLCVYMYVCMCVCMCVYVCVYVRVY